MVDVVNSALANAVILRGGAGVQPSVANAANNSAPKAPIESVAKGPEAPYLSLHISIDYDYDKAILQVRDSDTGDVQDQFPTQSRLAQLRRAQVQAEQVSQQTESVQPSPEVRTSESTPQVREAPVSNDIITVQEVTSAPVANTPQVAPQVAAAALSAGTQSSQPISTGVSVLT